MSLVKKIPPKKTRTPRQRGRQAGKRMAAEYARDPARFVRRAILERETR